MDYKKITNITFDGIDHGDHPDYCDTYIVSADYDGEPMSLEMLEELNEDSSFVYDKLMDFLY